MSASVSGAASTSLTRNVHVSQFSFFLVTQFNTYDQPVSNGWSKKNPSNYSCPGKVESVNANNKIRLYMLKVIHGPFRLFGCCQLLFGLYLKHHLRWNYTSPTHSLSSRSLMFSLRSLVSFVWSDPTCWFGRNQTQIVMAPVYLLFLHTCATARSQLVWDVSVFVFGMEHFVAPFCYLRKKSCAPSCLCSCWRGRAGKNRPTCLHSVLRIWQATARVFFPSRKVGKDGSCQGDVPILALTCFWGPACASAAGFGCDWQMSDVRRRSH